MKPAKNLKILQINKFHFIKGGAETAMFNLADLLKSKNHNVSFLSMNHPKNFNCKDSSYFVDNLDLDINRKYSLVQKFKISWSIIWSKKAQIKLDQFIKEKGKPDIAHLHNIYNHLTPSIIAVLKKHNIPIIQTLHDTKIICPNYKMLLKGRICEKCKGKKYYQCFLNKCIQDSYPKSFLGMLEQYYNRSIKDYTKGIDLFLAPSQFMKDKCIEFGISKEKIKVLKYYIDFKRQLSLPKPKEAEPVDNTIPYIVFFGRLSIEKGVKTLIKAWDNINDGNDTMPCITTKKNLKLKIVGTGPIEEELQQWASTHCSKGNIEFLGFKNKEELIPLIKNSQFVIIPSECYENSPLTAYESMALSKPVIASNIGGIPELVEHKKTGLLFKMGNQKDLTEKINWLINHPQKQKEFGKNARKKIEEIVDPENYYEKVIKIYESVIKR